MLSDSTARPDRDEKKAIYSRIAVSEYWLFDPRRDAKKPRREGYGLVGGECVQLGADALGRLRSPALDLDLLVLDERLRLRDPCTGRLLPTMDEAEESREAAAAGRGAAASRGGTEAACG